VADFARIRKIDLAAGKVSTLAGRSNAWDDRKQEDGTGAGASFWEITGMAVDHRNGNIYVSDACAIRRITPQGKVETVAGALITINHIAGLVNALGFEEWKEHPPEAKPGRMAGIPCLNLPRGLTLIGSELFIADRCNYTIRVLDVDSGRLITWIGEKGNSRFHPGRPREGGELPARFAKNPAEGGYATFALPSHVAFDPQGRCLVVLGESRNSGIHSCILRMEVDPQGAVPDPQERDEVKEHKGMR
jgi:hypothetical protein